MSPSVILTLSTGHVIIDLNIIVTSYNKIQPRVLRKTLKMHHHLINRNLHKPRQDGLAEVFKFRLLALIHNRVTFIQNTYSTLIYLHILKYANLKQILCMFSKT